jgi:hypothetical protein
LNKSKLVNKTIEFYIAHRNTLELSNGQKKWPFLDSSFLLKKERDGYTVGRKSRKLSPAPKAKQNSL